MSNVKERLHMLDGTDQAATLVSGCITNKRFVLLHYVVRAQVRTPVEQALFGVAVTVFDDPPGASISGSLHLHLGGLR